MCSLNNECCLSNNLDLVRSSTSLNTFTSGQITTACDSGKCPADTTGQNSSGCVNPMKAMCTMDNIGSVPQSDTNNSLDIQSIYKIAGKRLVLLGLYKDQTGSLRTFDKVLTNTSLADAIPKLMSDKALFIGLQGNNIYYTTSLTRKWANVRGPGEPDGKEVYYAYSTSDGNSAMTYSQANALATKLNAQLATKDQLQNTYQAGAQWCAPGWINDDNMTSSGQYGAWFPIQGGQQQAQCHNFTSADWNSPAGKQGDQQGMCTRRGFVWTQGNNADYPGCGGCWCCIPPQCGMKGGLVQTPTGGYNHTTNLGGGTHPIGATIYGVKPDQGSVPDGVTILPWYTPISGRDNTGTTQWNHISGGALHPWLDLQQYSTEYSKNSNGMIVGRSNVNAVYAIIDNLQLYRAGLYEIAYLGCWNSTSWNNSMVRNASQNDNSYVNTSNNYIAGLGNLASRLKLLYQTRPGDLVGLTNWNKDNNSDTAQLTALIPGRGNYQLGGSDTTNNTVNSANMTIGGSNNTAVYLIVAKYNHYNYKDACVNYVSNTTNVDNAAEVVGAMAANYFSQYSVNDLVTINGVNMTQTLQNSCNQYGTCQQTIESQCSRYNLQDTVEKLTQLNQKVKNGTATDADKKQIDQLNTQINWCGCFYKNSDYGAFVTTDRDGKSILPKKCTMYCSNSNVQPFSSNQGKLQPDSCSQNICVMNNVTIDLNKSKGGDFNFSQNCTGTQSGGQAMCYFDDVDINALQSEMGNVNFSQKCNTCWTRDSNGVIQNVPCAELGKNNNNVPSNKTPISGPSSGKPSPVPDPSPEPVGPTPIPTGPGTGNKPAAPVIHHTAPTGPVGPTQPIGLETLKSAWSTGRFTGVYNYLNNSKGWFNKETLLLDLVVTFIALLVISILLMLWSSTAGVIVLLLGITGMIIYLYVIRNKHLESYAVRTHRGIVIDLTNPRLHNRAVSAAAVYIPKSGTSIYALPLEDREKALKNDGVLNNERYVDSWDIDKVKLNY